MGAVTIKGMPSDQIVISIPASDYTDLRQALCKVGCGNAPDTSEASLLMRLMHQLEDARDQQIGGHLPPFDKGAGK